MDPSLPSSLESAAQAIYKKVIKQALDSRNSGKVAICCYTFFTRSMAGQAEEHEEVISTKEFCKQYQIKTEMDFINHCKSKNLTSDPQLNITHCRRKDKPAEVIISGLKTEIELLRAQLKEKDRQLASCPVDYGKAAC